MSTGVSLPGFDSPAVGFEQPFEMLEACHERVQRSLALLERLLAYITDKGHDAQSRTAAADVLRYFDLAAPLHHDDEEVHVFPLLLEQGDDAVRAAVRLLQEDHRRMSAAWAAAREPLLRWSLRDSSGPVDTASHTALQDFAALYGTHIQTEESLVYPAARALMDAPALGDMGRQMQARRRP
jgi:hemerythrin-like domain-containing protein